VRSLVCKELRSLNFVLCTLFLARRPVSNSSVNWHQTKNKELSTKYGFKGKHFFDNFPHVLWKTLWINSIQPRQVFVSLGLLANCTRQRRAPKLFTNICLHA